MVLTDSETSASVRPSHMQTYSSRPWSERAKVLGRVAEDAFEDWARKNGTKIERMGFRGSHLPRYALLQLPPSVRHIPDYLAYKNDELMWVECVGTASRTSFRVRDSKVNSQWYWHRDLKLSYFIYCSPIDSFGWATWDEVSAEIAGAATEYFSDGNAYHRIQTTGWTHL